jgi:hypothetical protein
MGKNTKEALLWGLVIVGAIFFLIFSGLITPQKFVILDDDFTVLSTMNFSVGQAMVDPQHGMVFSLNSITNNTINFTYVNNSYLGPSGKVYYAVDLNETNASSLFLYDTIPALPDGYHNIGKMKLTIINATAVKYEDWSLNTLINNLKIEIAANITSTQICNAVNGTYTNLTCTCPNGDKWFDNATSKVCGPIIKTVTNDVNVPVQPTFFQKYGLALIILIGAIVIIYMERKKKK